MEKILEGKRIFLVEDDVVNVAVYTTSLRAHGALIFSDVFGFGIVEHIRSSLPIHLIVLDIMLKRGIDGYDIYQDIRSDPLLKDIPIVAVTSLDPEKEIPKAKEMNFDGFISKPIKSLQYPKQLAAIIAGEKLWIVSR